jgi:glycosyltransferase involved in cell wall biosynthesis
MSSNSPLISVILPCFNAEKYIEESVRSILNQSYSNIELLIIDDGSTDSSLQIIQTIKDTRIKLVSQSNAGYKVTLNRLLELTNGEFIARQDADDISLPTRFENQIAFMLKNPKCAVLGTWAEIINNTDAVKKFHKHPTDNLSLKFFLLFDNPFVHSSVMMRKKFLLETGVYDIHKGWEDYDLWSRFARKYQIANLPQVLQVYRELFTGVSKTTQDYADRVNLISMENLLYYLPSSPHQVKDICCLYHGKYKEISAGCTTEVITNTFNQICDEIGNQNPNEGKLLNELRSYYMNILLKKFKRYKRYGRFFLIVRGTYHKWKKK